MGNTSVHFPEGLLEELDRLAAELSISRNRLIVETCQKAIRSRTEWPDGFFLNDHLSAEELEELNEGAEDFSHSIEIARKSRRTSPL